MTYAIISESGKQFRVEAGSCLHIDYRDAAQGDKIAFDQVLVVSDENGVRIGKPFLQGASVTAEVLDTELGEKLVVQKFRRRKNSRRKTGHRQRYTKIRIESVG